MKKVFIIIMILFCAGMIWLGLSNTSETSSRSLTPFYDYQSQVELQVTVCDEVSNLIHLKLINNSNVTIMYGNPFSLARRSLLGAQYIARIDNTAFTLLSFSLLPNSYVEYTIDLPLLFGDLRTGEYLITMDVHHINKHPQYGFPVVGYFKLDQN